MTQKIFETILNECAQSKNEKFIFDNMIKVIKTKNPYYICDFAERVPLADTPVMMTMLQNAIIETGDIYHIYEYAYCLAAAHKQNFNLKPFEELVIKSKDAKLMYYFLECVEGCNQKQMTKAFLSVKDPKWIVPYIENDEVEKFNTSKQLESIKNEAISSKENFVPQSLKKYFNKSLSLKEIEDKVVENKSPYEITELAEYFPECNQNRLFEAIMQTDDILHIYEYYCCVPNISLNQKNIIESKIKSDPRAVKIRYYLVAYTDLDNNSSLNLLNNLCNSGRIKYYNLTLDNMHAVRNVKTPYIPKVPVLNDDSFNAGL